jgi:hypothetical protein
MVEAYKDRKALLCRAVIALTRHSPCSAAGVRGEESAFAAIVGPGLSAQQHGGAAALATIIAIEASGWRLHLFDNGCPCRVD